MKKFSLLICLFICVNSIAQPFSKLKDIHPTATGSAINSLLFQRVGNTIYFLANDGITGNELWKSDGTEAGTVLVKDINPGAGGTNFNNIMVGGGSLLFFVAEDPVNGREPWISDGTAAGTFLLKDINPGTATSAIARCFYHNGLFYFGADNGTSGQELWKTDGTVAGTVMVKDILPGSGASTPASLSNNLSTFVAMGNDVYFTANDGVNGRELWKTDGTAANTVMVKDIIAGAGSGAGSTTHKAAVFNNKLYFTATDGVNGTELWSTDGTAANTLMVKNIVTGSGNSFPNDMVVFNGELFFTAATINNANPDLYKTDGTDAGTVLVRSLSADGIFLNNGNFTAINSFVVAGTKLFFRGNGPSGSELYVTDGTNAGTVIAKDIYPGTTGSSPTALLAFSNKLYFTGVDPSNNRGALYSSDGTEAGTQLVVTGDLSARLSVSTSFLMNTDTKLFFYGSDPDGVELWASDGTSAGTAKPKDINQLINGTPNTGSNTFGTVVFNGAYYFGAGDEEHGMELWKSDGTTAGTVMVKDIWPGAGPSVPASLNVFNGALYFTANDGTSGVELWKTDGTEAGTVMVTEIAPGTLGSSIFRMIPGANYFYFSAYNPSYGFELWRSDGTAAGTTMVVDLVSGPSSGLTSIQDGVTIGNDIYLMASLGAGNSLGTTAGNKLIKINSVTNTVSELSSVIVTVIDIQAFNNTIFITGRNATNQTLLWKVNGGILEQVKLLSTTATNAYQLTDCKNKLYFAASNGTAGIEPWISDGTEAGTYMIKDVNPGSNNSSPYQFVHSGGKVFFTASASGSTNGEFELWVTNGTSEGTSLVKDILPGSTGSRPSSTIPIPGNKILFTASDGVNGVELWQSDGTSAGTLMVQEFNTGSGDAFNTPTIFFNFPADFILTKKADDVFFFARNNLTGFQPYGGSVAGSYKYVNDNSTTNDVFTTAVGNNANNGSQSAPYATITYALSQASEGDTIYVDAGTFVEQVTITKGITIIGAGQDLTYVTNSPAVTLVPPPGTFTEIGLIQTGQNIADVHLSNMTVFPNSGSIPYKPHPIMMQSGGSVKGCTILNGGQGIFFRIQYATKTALIENNTITAEYIAINCEGSGLTTTLLNNTINVTNPGFSVGAFIGADGEGFSPLPQVIAIGNFLNSYVTSGFQVNASTANITQNSFLGTGLAIQQNNSNNLLNATCNWYNTTNAGTIASKISGNITFNPWLTSGTDNNVAHGFQPANGTCSGRTNYYVNDNSRTGDLFTTAIGSNANNGSQAAPFATISYALTQAAADDYIYVDAGTYAEQVTTDKGITIIGAGQDLTSILKPAITTAPPGSFTEQGVIQTSQSITGDVHISSLSVTGDYTVNVSPIIIQSGGSVRNCKLQNGNQGVFVRIDPVINLATKTFTIDGNLINAEYIAVNFAGTRLTGFLTNNTLATFNAGFSTGVFAGLDFGTLPGLTITGNTFNSYVSDGVLVNANNGTISQNSFLGIGQRAINKIGGNSMNATCNWYGSADQNIVIPKITGNASYSPWLINGTDNSVALGFQPLQGVCTGRQNKFYVNDNDITGDVFTGAVGNDANSGIPSAPLRTLEAAYAKAQNGDTIYMDAGSYVFNADYFIQKEITFIGTNYNVTPNDPLDKEKLNAARNKETEIIALSLSIKVSNVSFQGFTFDPGNKTPFTANDPLSNNFRLLKNRFKINSSLNQIHLVGSGTPESTPAQMVNSNVTISDNRFEKYGVNTGTTIVALLFKNIIISDNSFVTNGAATSFEHTAMALGFDNRPVDEVYVTNNLFDSLGLVLSGSRMGHVVISGNTMHDTRHLYNFANSYSHNSEFEFSGNLFESSLGIPVMGYNRQGGHLGTSSIYKVENNIIDIVSPGTSPVLANTPLNTTVAGSVINPTVIIRGNKISFAGNFGLVARDLLRPIVLRWNLRNVLIEKNEITYSGTNIGATSVNNLPTLPAVSIYTDNGVGQTIPPGSIINIFNNKIDGFRESVIIYDPNGGPTSSSNPFVGYGNLSAGVIVNINNNSFTGDVVSINNGTTSQEVQANCNWYGSASSQNILNKISLSTVDVVPWLTNGTDNEPLTTGFQPVPVSCDGYPPLIVLDSYTDVTCNGANNGSINITTTYGRAPFTYTWTKDGDPGFISHAEDLTNLSPGTYHLAVMDGNGSTIYITDPEADGPGTIDVTIIEPPVLTASASGTNVSCFNGTNGTASVLADGGTSPYTYLWSNGETSESISGLAVGIYSITVTDANGCPAQSSYEVTQPTQIIPVITNTSTACSNSAIVAVTGGTGSYSYLWSNGSTINSISSVPSGTYTVDITDENGCTVSAQITLASNEGFNPSASVVNVSCFGGNNGSITVTNVNGTAPFQYSIDGLNFQSSNVFSNLVAGNYAITVVDANGCTGFVSKAVTQPTELLATLNTVQNTCFGQSTGSVNVSVSGGSPSYSYSWSGPGGYTSSQLNISNLAAGVYTLTVTDNKDCTDVIIAEVNNFPVMQLNTLVTNIACKGSLTGSIDLTLTGGTGSGFTYLWNTGATSQDLSNLGVGNYNVVVTDIGSGCTVSGNFIITQPVTNVNISTSKTNATGCNSLGTITATGSGGTSPYTYSLNNGIYQSSGSFNGLYAGNYTVTVKDANGCTKTSAIIGITDNGSDEFEGNNSKNQAKTINLSAVNSARIATAADAADWFKFTTTAAGAYTFMLTHPSATFTYNVYPGGNNTAALTPLSTGTNSKTYTLNANTIYYVSVTGGLSYICYQFSIVNGGAMTKTSGSESQKETEPNKAEHFAFDVKVFGNPSQSNFGLQVLSSSDEKIMIRIIDVNGRVIEILSNVQVNKMNRFGDKYRTGAYFAEIIQGKNRKTVKLIKM